MYSFFTLSFFFFNATATTDISTLSLHDALPICFQTNTDLVALSHLCVPKPSLKSRLLDDLGDGACADGDHRVVGRSEEHTSELQSRQYLVCRLLLEKKKNKDRKCIHYD